MNILAMIQNSDVEWKTLGEIATIKTGQMVNKKDIADNPGDYPVINSGREPLGYIDKWNTDNDPIGITSRGAGVGSIIWQEGKYFRGNLNYSVTIKSASHINVRFLYHILLEFQNQINALSTFTGIPALNASELKKLEIPIPPLAVQEKIVQILDNFTELTTELTIREKQYAYYREKLLNFDDQAETIEWRALKEISLQTHNIKWQKNQETYQYIDLTSVNRENHKIEETIEISAANAPSRAQKIVEEEDVIFATTRPTQQRVTLVNNEYSGAIASTGYCVLRANKNVVLPKWIYFNTLSKTFQKYLEENQSGSAYPAISDTKLKEFGIPIPPLAEQARIVAILDKFDALTHSITEGLPREIELRQKQYEYYRNLLLSFPKPENKL